MDRTRVLCPSISVAAHAAGAAILAVVPLLLPAAVPEPRRVGHVAFPGTLSVGLGGGGPRGGSARVAHSTPQPSRLAAPAFVSPIVPEPTIDLGNGASIPGLPQDGEPGADFGSCLFGCDPSTTSAPGLGEAEPPKAPAHPARVRVGGDVREPRKVRHVAPVYPPLAVAAHVQGSVHLECVIEEDGRVSEIAVVRGHPLLDAAAVEAVRQWRYVPSLLNGARVSVVLTVIVDFRLR